MKTDEVEDDKPKPKPKAKRAAPAKSNVKRPRQTAKKSTLDDDLSEKDDGSNSKDQKTKPRGKRKKKGWCHLFFVTAFTITVA